MNSCHLQLWHLFLPKINNSIKAIQATDHSYGAGRENYARTLSGSVRKLAKIYPAMLSKIARIKIWPRPIVCFPISKIRHK